MEEFMDPLGLLLKPPNSKTLEDKERDNSSTSWLRGTRGALIL